jgi:hypothetical protein
LAADLDNAAGLLFCRHHLIAIPDSVGHGLFTINILAGLAGINQYLFVPVIRRGADDAVDILVVEQFPIPPGGGHRLADDLQGQALVPVVDVRHGGTLRAGHLQRGLEQPRASNA